MQNIRQQVFACALALVAQEAHAAITANGIWSNNDWYDNANKLGVANGIPYSNDTAMNKCLISPLSKDGSIDDFMSMTNVQRVQQILPESSWDTAFPHRNALYTYNDFLKAVGKFPAFCNETDLAGKTLDESCKRELSTLFAHWGQETGARDPGRGEFWTQALYYVSEICSQTGSCSEYKSFNWSNDVWPNQAGVKYYGRGPFQLSWNYNYGAFSNIFATSSYNGKLELLQDPDTLARDGYAAMAAGIWFYMTPQDPKPSMHEVMTGSFVPNSIDLQNNMTASFATTINIINGGLECGKGFGYDKVVKRGEYFTEWLGFFGLPAENNLDCGNQPNQFPAGGSSDLALYFDKDWSGGNKCKLVNWMTGYSAVARDDYKRCVCDLFGSGEADCPKGPDDTSNVDTGVPVPAPAPTPAPTPSPTPAPQDDVWLTWATLQEIRDTPHYSPTSYSRTLYQVDRELDFIEAKLVELYQVAVDNNLLQN